MNSYEEVKAWREKDIKKVTWDHFKLNEFHEKIMKEIINIALRKIESEMGPPPSHFAFFVMGSAGRKEQSIWSDQDHGIIYKETTELAKNYFLKVGAEITKGFTTAGYVRCDGKVMAENPYWCKSSHEWDKQIEQWFDEADWEALRYFITFFDSRVLAGDLDLLVKLKNRAFAILDENRFLYNRLVENVLYIKKGIGVFGQLLPYVDGEKSGKINIKQTILFPYVNSIRLLALLEKVQESSTLERLQQLPLGYEKIKSYQADFLKLLNYRLYFQKNSQSYETVHLLHVSSMSRKEKEGIKQIIKNGHKLFKVTKEIVEQRCLL